MSKLKVAWNAVNMRYLAVCAIVVSCVLDFASSAMATESEAAKGVAEAAGKVNTEGVEILIKVLLAVIALVVFVIVVPKAIKFIKRLV